MKKNKLKKEQKKYKVNKKTHSKIKNEKKNLTDKGKDQMHASTNAHRRRRSHTDRALNHISFSFLHTAFYFQSTLSIFCSLLISVCTTHCGVQTSIVNFNFRSAFLSQNNDIIVAR